MATCLEDSLSQSVCSVCFERFKVPRKLPTCAHSFCEECIVIYSTSLFENNEDGTPIELPCPLCREVNQLPADNTDVGEWVSSLELNEELAKSAETESQNELPELCARCKESSRPVSASKYCFECQEHLCERCCRTGHRFKLLWNHSIIETTQLLGDKKQKELMERMSVYTLCKRHPEKKLRFICVEEGKLCCDTCRDVLHSTCKDVKEIKDYANKDALAEGVPKLKEILSKLSDLSKVIIQRKKENEVSNKTDSQTILGEIQTMRQRVNQVFDAVEDNVREQCKALTKKCALAEQEDISKLQDLIQSFDASSKILDKALDLAPLDSIFIILHELQNSLVKQEIAVLEFRHKYQRLGLEFKLDTLLRQIQDLSPNEACEMVEVNVKKTDMELPTYSERHLIRYCNFKENGKRLGSGMSQELHFTGMAVIPDDTMIVVEHNIGRCVLIDSMFKMICYTTLADNGPCQKRYPRSVCYLGGNVVAVSVPDEKKICLIDTHPKTLKVAVEVCTEYEPLALHRLGNGDIAVSWNDPVGFGFLTLNQTYIPKEKLYFDRDQRGRIIKSFWYMAIDEERSQIIQPCIVDKAVFCFDFAGVPKFAYKHPELTNPQGVNIDPDSAIYVCDKDHDCIHILSPSGEPARILREGIPKQPINVIYMSKSEELVVANDSKPCSGIFRFKVEI